MTYRFIVTASLSEAGEKAFLAYLKEHGVGWWHRAPSFWLLVTRRQGAISVIGIRDKLRELGITSAVALVMEIPEDITWAGLHPPDRKDTFDWLRNTWVDKV
ncbi:hypothetical protein [Sphingomonas sp. Root241]|uniref:hypothetical protein n=1 Tax=Sphingomonas sp. Root241 TaxID=1736501 RepID=UPI0006F9B74A|nr:hypothetical protein [Sphingomonas sp. Root241]KRC79957.1 hypothetical protein ASE13_12980 [Sphingomonas sp. Root241]